MVGCGGPSKPANHNRVPLTTLAQSMHLAECSPGALGVPSATLHPFIELRRAVERTHRAVAASYVCVPRARLARALGVLYLGTAFEAAHFEQSVLQSACHILSVVTSNVRIRLYGPPLNLLADTFRTSSKTTPSFHCCVNRCVATAIPSVVLELLRWVAIQPQPSLFHKYARAQPNT